MLVSVLKISYNFSTNYAKKNTYIFILKSHICYSLVSTTSPNTLLFNFLTHCVPTWTHENNMQYKLSAKKNVWQVLSIIIDQSLITKALLSVFSLYIKNLRHKLPFVETHWLGWFHPNINSPSTVVAFAYPTKKDL